MGGWMDMEDRMGGGEGGRMDGKGRMVLR